MTGIDHTDRLILKELLLNSNQSVKEIATKVNLSVSPVHERIKKLEQSGLLKNYTAIIDSKKLGFELIVYIQVKFVKHQEDIFEEFRKNILGLQEISEACFTAGEYDALLKVILEDMNAYHKFILHKLSKMDVISNVRSSFVMRYITEDKHIINPEILNSKF